MPEVQPFKSEQIQVYRIGHKLYPSGCVVVHRVENDGTEDTDKYTLEEWEKLQKSQQSQE